MRLWEREILERLFENCNGEKADVYEVEDGKVATKMGILASRHNLDGVTVENGKIIDRDGELEELIHALI